MPSDGELHRVVANPQGDRYEITAVQKDWSLGTGSLVMDAAAFLWGLIRQARRKDWVVSVKRVDSKSEAVTTETARSQQEAASVAEELKKAIETGELS